MSQPAPSPAIAVVVPTYNERDNVGLIVDAVRRALDGEHWELIFVDDDSPDGTVREVERFAAADGRVRRLRRVGRHGLASACIEGILASTAPHVAVMDGDAQHDPGLLPQMLKIARERDCDVVIATREPAGVPEAQRGALRRWLTRTGNRLGRYLIHGVARDPLSGFFVARRELVERRVRRLYGHGFKILLDLLSAGPEPLAVAEVPTRLRERVAGESKMSARVALDYALLLGYRLAGRVLPPRFALYCVVGLSGVGVNLAVLAACYAAFGGKFLPAQIVATVAAMTTNFFLNNLITFRDRMLTGRALWRGLASFYAACSLGAIVGVAVGDFLHTHGAAVWVAGLGSALASAIWNFTLNDEVTWRDR